MEPLQLLTHLWNRDAALGRARSALPNAPRVPEEPGRPVLGGVRASFATLLRRTAARVEPASQAAEQGC